VKYQLKHLNFVHCFFSFVSDEGYQEFLSAKHLMETNSTEHEEIKKLLRSSLTKMTQTLEDNLLYYKIPYMLIGMITILLVRSL